MNTKIENMDKIVSCTFPEKPCVVCKGHVVGLSETENIFLGMIIVLRSMAGYLITDVLCDDCSQEFKNYVEQFQKINIEKTMD